MWRLVCGDLLQQIAAEHELEIVSEKSRATRTPVRLVSTESTCEPDRAVAPVPVPLWGEKTVDHWFAEAEIAKGPLFRTFRKEGTLAPERNR